MAARMVGGPTLWRRVWTAAASLAVFAACGQAPLPADQGAGLLFTCGGHHAFRKSILMQPGNAERSLTPWSAALRAFIEAGVGTVSGLPAEGWVLVGLDEQSATFVAPGEDAIDFISVGVVNEGGEWTVSGNGYCRPTIALGGDLGNASWAFDPDLPRPDATATDFIALVTEHACASGQSSEGRVSDPMILYGQDEVLVIFGVRPLPGFSRCPGNPPTRISVHLDEPLGDRRLLDGAYLPPHDPNCRDISFC